MIWFEPLQFWRGFFSKKNLLARLTEKRGYLPKKKAASISCLKAMKTIKQCSENRKLETIK